MVLLERDYATENLLELLTTDTHIYIDFIMLSHAPEVVTTYARILYIPFVVALDTSHCSLNSSLRSIAT